MKAIKFLILIVLLIGIVNCEKDETTAIDEGLSFRQYNPKSKNNKTSFSIVQYEEIIGYDSAKYIFKLEESAWARIENQVAPVMPDPKFGFFVALNNEFIYEAAYIQPYSSLAHRDIITFQIQKPNMVFIRLGYPAVPKNEFTGHDLRNTPRLIEQLGKDNKLIKINNEREP